MDLTLQVNCAQHDSNNLLASWRVVPRIHWLARFLDTRDLDEPDDRITQIDEKPEPVVAQHDARRDHATSEN